MFDTSGKRHSCGALALLSVLLCLAPIQPSVAQSASASFVDGNRLFRDDLYWAALLRYDQARKAGMDSPLLHYNMGVAHYRAGQHIRARTELLRAAEFPSLRVLSHYNLGLNAYAAGDVEDALGWFYQARDQEENRKIRRLAIKAIARLQVVSKEADPILARVEKRQEERNFADFSVNARIGFGSDDNVFRAPTQPYIDFADPNRPLVTPEEISGAFMPVDLQLKYSVNSLKFESFYGAYRLAGRYYQDKELENANEFSHEARFGSEFDRKTETRERQVRSAFTFAQHNETYYDPDDGTSRTVNGEPIDDRMNYVRYGPEITFRQSHEKLAFGLRLKGQLWNYEESMVVPEYDHEYFLFGVNVQYRFTVTSLLRVTAEKYSRRYGDRPSFDLNGQQLITNPDLRYDYLELGLTARQRITPNMWFGVNYERTARTDQYLGYNDYTRDHYGVDFSWSPGDRFDLTLKGYYRNYDFPNAFAFHNPVASAKTLETANSQLLATFRITRSLSLVVDANFRESASTDTRIAYERARYSIGISWQR